MVSNKINLNQETLLYYTIVLLFNPQSAHCANPTYQNVTISMTWRQRYKTFSLCP